MYVWVMVDSQCNSYCTIVFGKQKCNSAVVYDNAHPRYAESFVFTVPEFSESYFAGF